MDPENFLWCWWKTLLLFFSSRVRSDFVSPCQWGETPLTPDRGHTPSGLTCQTSRSGSVSSCMPVLCCLCIVSVPQKHDAGSAIITIITCKGDTLLWRLRRKFVRVLDGEVKSWKWAEILQTPHLFCTQWSSQYTAWGVLTRLLFVKKLEFNINKDFWILDSLIPIQDSWGRKCGDAAEIHWGQRNPLSQWRTEKEEVSEPHPGAGEFSAGSHWDRKSLRPLPTTNWLASVTPDPGHF